MGKTDLAVSVQNLTVKFGDFNAVEDITFDVKSGEIFGFLGANGAGKTTTIRVICGLQRPTLGAVYVQGVRLTHDSKELERIKSMVGYMSQKFTLYQDLTVAENLEFAASLRKIAKADFVRRKKELLQFIELEVRDHQKVATLSAGVKQQVSLIASLIHRPSIVFLDEPTAGVSPVSRYRFWNLIRSLAKDGTTVFVTTHYMDEAEQCQRIALMRSGTIVAIDGPEALKMQTFPTGMIEISGKELNPQKLKEKYGATYAEIYGMRAHVSFDDVESKTKLFQALGNSGTIREIAPSLEDVFLKRVES